MRVLVAALAFFCLQFQAFAAEPLVIGLSYPSTGSYKWEGLSQKRGALMAVEEINREGGVLGRQLKLVSRNSGAMPDRAVQNVERLAADGAVMLMGGASSDEVIAAGERARQLHLPYFVPTAYSNRVTGRAGHAFLFREGASARMANNLLMEYLETTLPGKRYFIITSDTVIPNGRSSDLGEASRSRDLSSQRHYREALKQAAQSKTEVLILMLYGTDVVNAMRMVDHLGLKKRMQVVVPNLNQDVVDQAGPALMSGVIGTDTWTWRVPEREGNPSGKRFVADYSGRYQSYPSSAAASAYGIVRQWADAAVRAGTTESTAVIAALEGHTYRLLKDEQTWRALDHQNLQGMYVVRVKPRAEVLKDELKQDYFEILYWMEGEVAAPTEKEVLWERSPEGPE
ncbi:ABC transporter substrate-binding protein [Aquipseudomonas ullengensis]|uniref:ABC transporter substrate-binding protein n=1 Tax=Aquipseudomonas ullengensis TaxID=2759166 RepID=A0A7W4QEQ0_9GAMM|nr:ABC transporter substrate-binding protein [Pseudomonas ullengensis]MBB2497386.1 ABC transporter substrate-binding protein [Pseudomonas ullengensis]